MEILEAALDAGAARRPCGADTGEAGAGKSRLCAKFVGRCRERGIPVLTGRDVAHGKSVPLLRMLALWRAYYASRTAIVRKPRRRKSAV
jgi:ABC-type cobalamin transport system ATPase subunit